MFLASHNARLSAVSSSGGSEDYDLTSSATLVGKWAGDAEALIVEHVVAVQNGERLDQVKQTHMEIPANLGVDVAPDDLVTFTDREGRVGTRRVQQVQTPQLVGVIRLFFWDAPQMDPATP